MKKSLRRLLAAAVALCCVTVFLSAFIGDVRAEETILAERAEGGELLPGDRVVLVCDAARNTLSLEAAGTRLASVAVTTAETPTRRVLTEIGERAAVFEVGSAGGGLMYLRCEKGYLTSSETGNGLYYAAEPADQSKWQLQEGKYLYNPFVSYTSGKNTYRDYCLEYYNAGNYFSTWGKRADADPSAFAFSFYRLGNTDPEEEIAADESYTLPLFETSDVHGTLADTSGEEPVYLLAYISDKVKDARENGDDRAILLDGGDIHQGSTPSNLLDWQPLSAAYRLMGYDAVALGNHEFDRGIAFAVDADGTMKDCALEGYEGENRIPVLVSDLYLNGEKAVFGGDYLILDKTAVNADGETLPVRIGVIGFAGNYASSIRYERFSGAGYSIVPDMESLKETAEWLEKEGGCDATVLLAHEEASEIAEAVGEDSAIDLVLGGHTHRNLAGQTERGLWYLEPAANGSAYAYCELAFDLRDGGAVFRKVTRAQTVSVTAAAAKCRKTPANAEELDADIVKLTDTVLEAVSDILKRQIGYITGSALRYAYLPESGERATSAGNWQASIIARIAGADIGFVNNGGLRVDFPLAEGRDRREISLSDIYAMFPFDNKIYCFELTWEELLAALTYSLTENGWTLLSQMVGVDCYYTDGKVNAIVTADGEAVYRNGEWKEGWKEKKIRVGVSDFVATTNRVSWGMPNPFCAWAETERLVSCDTVDCEGAREVLTAEAEANGGYLAIDTKPHYINRAYTDGER